MSKGLTEVKSCDCGLTIGNSKEVCDRTLNAISQLVTWRPANEISLGLGIPSCKMSITNRTFKAWLSLK